MARDATAAAEPSEDEYQTFCAVLTASARGCVFFAEYARRHRGADTETPRVALARLRTLGARAGWPGADALRSELLGPLTTIRAARPELKEAARPAKFSVLLALTEEERLALVT